MSFQQLRLNCNIKHSLSIVLIIVCEILSSEVRRPRGVSLSRASLYDPEKDFLCFDGSLTVPFTQVNDDYCDCPDGSDEPGTSACPNGSFYCTNAGHRPMNIHSSRVNDGVCDCCDGADEYNSKSQCGNNCHELGRTAREEAQRQAELVKVGNQLRLDYSQKGVQLKQEKKDKLAELHKHKDEADLILKEKEELKKQAEDAEGAVLEQYRAVEELEKKKREAAEAADTRKEATETFDRFDSNQDGKIDISELQARQTFDKDRNGEVSEDEARFFLNEQDSLDLEAFIAEGWPRIKPFLMLDQGIFKPPSAEGEEQVDDHESVEGDAEELPEEDHGEEHDMENEGEEEEEEEEDDKAAESTTPEPPRYDDETQKLVDIANEARREYESAKQAVRDIAHEINNIQDYLEKDYGPDEEFAVLEGQCFEYSDHEYIYKLCPFDRTVQQPKSNSLETRLGTWSKWVGPEGNKYQAMMYDGGQSCWNGPQRSTKVNVACGGENKIISVAEPNRCEYKFDFITPAACKEIVDENADDLHDEL